MSEKTGTNKEKTDNKPSNVKIDSLLPPAKIHLFSDDLDTLNLAHALGEDWRFGRVNIGMRGDNLDDAIEHYSRRKSPTLIIIQTEETGDDFEAKLGELANVCEEGTAAIVVGPVNDVQLYRHLTSIGISDYLVAPLDMEDVVNAIASALQNIVGAVDSHLMAFVGVKGGVGTTSLTAMTADVMSDYFQAKTLVLDIAGGNSTLWNHFGFAPSGTLIEAARAVIDNDTDALNRLIIKKSDTLHVLNSGTENILDNPVAPQAFEMMLDHFLSIYPYIIVDTSQAPAQIKRMILARANSVAIVATPRVPDLSLTKMMVKTLAEMPGADGRHISIFTNKMGIDKSDIKGNDVKEALGVKNIIESPWNNQLFSSAENSGESLSSQKGFDKYQDKIVTFISEDSNFKHFKHDMRLKMNGGLITKFKNLISGDK